MTDTPTTDETDVLAYGFEDAVRTTGLSRPTLQRLIRKGELKAFKVGSRTMFARTELVRFIASRQAA